MLDRVLKYLEEKYRVRPKVKKGKLYQDMHRVQTSSSMGIVCVYPDGSFKQIDGTLYGNNINLGEFSQVLYIYFGSNYLTVNTYNADEIYKASGWSMRVTDVARVEKPSPAPVNSGTRVAAAKLRTSHSNTVVPKTLREELSEDTDDVPW